MTETQKCLEHSDAKYTIYGTPAPFAHPHCAEKTLPFIITFDSVSYHTGEDTLAPIVIGDWVCTSLKDKLAVYEVALHYKWLEKPDGSKRGNSKYYSIWENKKSSMPTGTRTIWPWPRT